MTVRYFVVCVVAACYQPATLAGSGSDGSVITSSSATLTAGDAFACKLDGTSLTCWGRNTDGEIPGFVGDAATTPQAIMGDWQQADAGGFHACGITTAGSLHCWGRDDHGQVDGSIPTAGAPLGDTVLTFDGHTAWKQVAAGLDHTCAIASDDSLYCWGDDASGELGIDPSAPPSAVHVPGADDWSVVATGTHATCAVSASRGLMCWGGNLSGQLGTGATSPFEKPTAVDLPVSGTVTSIAMATATTCVVAGDSLVCWGAGLDGQLGEVPPVGVQAVPTLASTKTGWKQVAASAPAYLCGIRDGDVPGELWCWGIAKLGGLGNGRFVTPDGVFVKVGAGATALAVGFVDNPTYAYASGDALDDLELSCAVLDHITTCWGDDRFGELGNATRTRETQATPVPFPVGIVEIAAGASHVCARDTAGAVWCWGGDTNQEIGAPIAGCPAGAECDAAAPQQVPGLTQVTHIVAGGDHTCALHGGAVRCWGAASDHRLGAAGGNVNDVSLPSNVTSLRASGETTCVDSGGSALCFGAVSPLPSTFTDPSAQPGFQSTKQLAFTRSFGCATFADGMSDLAIKCIGDNTSGELGDGNFTTSNSAFVVAAVRGFAVAVGLDASYACAANGSENVLCWGLNDRGQLGATPASLPQTAVPTPVISSGMCFDVVAGADGGCALCDGAIQCWGGNMEGQVGNHTAQSTTVEPPQTIPSTDVWDQVVAGERFFCALGDNNGPVVCWGFGPHGELGNGAKSANRPLQTIVGP